MFSKANHYALTLCAKINTLRRYHYKPSSGPTFSHKSVPRFELLIIGLTGRGALEPETIFEGGQIASQVQIACHLLSLEARINFVEMICRPKKFGPPKSGDS
jgi:hypothetical protein